VADGTTQPAPEPAAGVTNGASRRYTLERQLMTGAAGIALNTPMQTVASNVNARDEAQELFEAHGASLFRFARVMLRTPQDAEDVVQTTFVRLLDHLGRGGARSNLKAWLFSVTANLCRDQLRARRRWLGLLPEHDRLLSTPPALESRDPIELFLTVVRTLTPRDRLLLALKAQGLSYREIAAAAGVRENSIGRLLARALTRWRRARAAMSHT
jgi:RNA polymerase sigma-70 factor, ECF subfamily